MLSALILIALISPLIGFLILMPSANTFSKRLTSFVGCGSIFISLVCFIALWLHFIYHDLQPLTFFFFQWIPLAGINADFSLHLDSLSILMTLIITGVGFLIHIYSIGYMSHDKDYVRFFACMNLFVFAMLLLVLASNLLLLFVGWEGVGLASYLLIGFWYERPSAATAATKAFVVNRIGDLGLLLGILLTLYIFETGDIETVSAKASQGFASGSAVITILTLLYFCGSIGKSAQIPLHTWLPDAMEGPTPVSALIHAATMVTAGVYLLVRMHVVLMLAPETLFVVGFIGAATALFAAISATAQTDLKRVLAYSTVSQLGYMFVACSVGAFYTAMFHLMAHAFMKGLLFLSAGNIVHMMHDTTDMGKMGGLAKKFPKTNILFLIGALSMAGIPPLAAFFSKDEILEQAFDTGHLILFLVGLIAAVITGIYLIRAYCLTFLGKPNISKEELAQIHEAPAVMTGPCSVLAFLCIIGGFLGFGLGYSAPLQRFLAQSDVMLAKALPSALEFYTSFDAILSIFGALLGVVGTYFIYTRYQDRLGKNVVLFLKAFYIDEIYDRAFVRPLKGLSHVITGNIETSIIDGSISGSIKSTQKIARVLQRMQSGQIRAYVAWMAIGACFLILILIL